MVILTPLLILLPAYPPGLMKDGCKKGQSLVDGSQSIMLQNPIEAPGLLMMYTSLSSDVMIDNTVVMVNSSIHIKMACGGLAAIYASSGRLSSGSHTDEACGSGTIFGHGIGTVPKKTGATQMDEIVWTAPSTPGPVIIAGAQAKGYCGITAPCVQREAITFYVSADGSMPPQNVVRDVYTGKCPKPMHGLLQLFLIFVLPLAFIITVLSCMFCPCCDRCRPKFCKPCNDKCMACCPCCTPKGSTSKADKGIES
mmetsp:Transcript_31357/g.81926  ORF Transcript_31357/g.81926 Transcript_31357/m.81926 type:complete len:254 (-) Transcript_31357:128-889(-)